MHLSAIPILYLDLSRFSVPDGMAHRSARRLDPAGESA